MAKIDVRISDSLLDEIIEYYKKADPIEFPSVFGIYIALKELRQIRDTGLTPEEISLYVKCQAQQVSKRELQLGIERDRLKEEISTLKAELRQRDMPCEKCVYSSNDNCDGCKWWKGDWVKPSLYKQRGLEESHEI